MTDALLETGSTLPIGVTGWTVLLVSLAIAALWLSYLYR